MGGNDELVIVRFHSKNEDQVVAENDAGIELHANITSFTLKISGKLSLYRENSSLVAHTCDRVVGIAHKFHLL